MSYKIIPRIYNKKGKKLKFHFKDDPDFAMIQLCCVDEFLNRIENVNRKIINYKKIIIYFPIFDETMVKTYTSYNGWTLRKLFKAIEKLSRQAGKYSITNSPEIWNTKFIKNPKNLLKGFEDETIFPENVIINKNNVYITATTS